MKVLILGFKNKEEIDVAIEKLITENNCFIFDVVCGNEKSAAIDWAEWRGCPLFHTNAKKPDDLEYWSDYILIKIDNNTPQWQKNLMMKFKANGKHGTIIRP